MRLCAVAALLLGQEFPVPTEKETGCLRILQVVIKRKFQLLLLGIEPQSNS